MKKARDIKFLLIFLSCFVYRAFAQPVLNLVPMPASVQTAKGSFSISKNTIIVIDGTGLERSANFLVEQIFKNFGYRLKVVEGTTVSNTITLGYERLNHAIPGAYNLNIGPRGAHITGDNEAGVFYGVQTLLQLLPLQKIKNGTGGKLTLPFVKINDFPRLIYRGMHLDAGRHFFSVDYIKKYLDYLAYHKFNTFHWHLTEDQGWRIEIKKYPRLTEVGGYRNGTIVGRYPGKQNDSIRYGGYYTQDQVKEIVKYAADRYISVIPEIEMPGHSSAAIAAYPELSCFPGESTKILDDTPWAGSREGKQVQQTWGVFEDVFCPTEYTFKFIENVLDEVMQLFPAPYIHIGGDECPKESWKRSAFAQNLIKEKNLKDENGLQSYFISRIESYINSKGKTIIGWDEILEGGLAPNATVMSWRGEKGGITAAKEKHFVIMTPESPLYLNHAQSKQEDSVTQGGFNSLEAVYKYDAVPAVLNDEEAKFILGGQGNMWSEYIKNSSKLEYMLFPRMSALSEALWSPKKNRNWASFEQRLPLLFQRYENWGANYSRAYYDLQTIIKPTPDNKGVLLSFESRSKKDRIVYSWGVAKSATKNYTGPILVTGTSEYGAALTDPNNRIISSWRWNKFSFNKATGKKITLKNQPSAGYPGSGAFTLVNGIITERNLLQSSEWLGFAGKDLEAVIDLGKTESINTINLNILHQQGSWIYAPSSVEFLVSNDGNNFTSAQQLNPYVDGVVINKRKLSASFTNTTARYVKIIAKNYGMIPSGKPGAGHAAWLFVDEIVVE